MSSITVEQQDFKDFQQPKEKSIIVTNPPYGERISTPDLLGTYRMIGERLKHQFIGGDAWILSYREECFEQIGLKPSLKIPVYNGSLECEFRKYQLFDGKLREFRFEGGVVKTDDEKRQMAEKHRFKKNREFKERITQQEENAEADIRSFTFHRHDLDERRNEFNGSKFGGERRRARFDHDDDDNRRERFGKREGDRRDRFDRRDDNRRERFDKRESDRRGRFDKREDDRRGSNFSPKSDNRGGHERFNRQGNRGGKKPFSRGTRKSFNHDDED
jgi:putative N6-adenine-specific DNA methylase